MSQIIETTTHEGIKIINIQFEDGSSWSGLKSAYDAWVAEGNTATEWSPEA
jgi:hypothetical protein